MKRKLSIKKVLFLYTVVFLIFIVTNLALTVVIEFYDENRNVSMILSQNWLKSVLSALILALIITYMNVLLLAKYYESDENYNN